MTSQRDRTHLVFALALTHLCVNRTEVRILEQMYEVRLSCLLQRNQRLRLPSVLLVHKRGLHLLHTRARRRRRSTKTRR